MDKIKEICEQLQMTSGKKDKEQILHQNKDNRLLQDVLQFVFNPFILTGLSDKKINKKVSVKNTYEIEDIFHAMQYLKEKNTGTDEVISNIQYFLNNEFEDMRDFYKQIFTKSLKLGCDTKTFNKVWGKGFIPTFDCMLAEKYFDKPQKVEGKDFTITLKLDGIRCLAVKENGKVSLFSRQGQPIVGLIDVEDEIKDIHDDNFVLDGELLISDVAGILSKDQYKATSKIVRKDGEKHGITYRVFDWLELDEFKNQKCKHTYTERRNILTNLNTLVDFKYIEILPVLYSGNDTNKIMELLDKVRADGQEGVMVNINDAVYDFKRTSNLLKCKVMQDCDLKIIGFEEGSGRLSGTLGRINVDYKDSMVGVGSGFSDSDREYFWANQDTLIGRVITVQYFEETEDKKGVKSLRFPVYKELREIGKEESYN